MTRDVSSWCSRAAIRPTPTALGDLPRGRSRDRRRLRPRARAALGRGRRPGRRRPRLGRRGRPRRRRRRGRRRRAPPHRQGRHRPRARARRRRRARRPRRCSWSAVTAAASTTSSPTLLLCASPSVRHAPHRGPHRRRTVCRRPRPRRARRRARLPVLAPPRRRPRRRRAHHGLRFPLHGETLEPGSTRGVSNEFLATDRHRLARARRAPRRRARLSERRILMRRILASCCCSSARHGVASLARHPPALRRPAATSRRPRSRSSPTTRSRSRSGARRVHEADRHQGQDPAGGRRRRRAQPGDPHQVEPDRRRVLRRRQHVPQPRARRGRVRRGTRPPELDDVPTEYQLDPSHRLTPIDHGDVCINYDKQWFAQQAARGPDDARRSHEARVQGTARRREPGDVVARPRVPARHHRALRRRRLAATTGRSCAPTT